MATPADPNRPSPTPLDEGQRQRLEAAQFAKWLVASGYYEMDKTMGAQERVRAMLEVADWIVTGAF